MTLLILTTVIKNAAFMSFRLILCSSHLQDSKGYKYQLNSFENSLNTRESAV